MKKLKLLMLSFALTCLMGMTVSATELEPRAEGSSEPASSEQIRWFACSCGYTSSDEDTFMDHMFDHAFAGETASYTTWFESAPSETPGEKDPVVDDPEEDGPVVDDPEEDDPVVDPPVVETPPETPAEPRVLELTYGDWNEQYTTIQTTEREKEILVELSEADEARKNHAQSLVDTEGANAYYLSMWAIVENDDNPNEALTESMVIKINIPEIKKDSKVEVWKITESATAMNISSQGDGYVIFTYDGPVTARLNMCITVRGTESTGTNTEANTEENKDSSKNSNKSGGSSAVEEVRFTTTLSPAAEVSLSSGAADLQIGPPTRTFYESDGQALLGTTDPVSVYLADFWLADRATGAVVTPGADGAIATINIPGVTASSRVMIRQWPYGTDEYVDFAPVEVGNGYIKVKFTTMSQAAICVAGADAAATADTTAAAAGKVTPKTSDSVLIYAAEAIALVSILGFVVCRKKSA